MISLSLSFSKFRSRSPLVPLTLCLSVPLGASHSEAIVIAAHASVRTLGSNYSISPPPLSPLSPSSASLVLHPFTLCLSVPLSLLLSLSSYSFGSSCHSSRGSNNSQALRLSLSISPRSPRSTAGCMQINRFVRMSRACGTWRKLCRGNVQMFALTTRQMPILDNASVTFAS